MQCPFCTANIPVGSELCPHCMSDLRNASPRGDRATATDSGGSAGYVPPRHGYVPPTRPWGEEPPPAEAPFDATMPAVSPPAQPDPPAAPAPQPPPTGYAQNPMPSAAVVAYPPVAQPIGYAVPIQPQPQPIPPQQGAPLPPIAPTYASPAPPAPHAPVMEMPVVARPVHVDPPAIGRETARQQPGGAAPQGRRRTALDAEAGPSPHAEGVRGRTRLDKDAPGARAAGTAAAPLRRVVGWMISFDVNEEGQEYVIREGRNLLGRARDADISIFYDDRVSSTHATIVYRNGSFVLRDEMTNNGTFLNGHDIGPGDTVALNNGDVLRVGRCTFKLFLLDPAEVVRLWPHVAATR